MSEIDPIKFHAKYGPWAVITGASDGTGAAYAHQLAALGLNLVLIARRPEPLLALATALEQEHGIHTRTASIDLYEPGAGAHVLAAAEGMEVGLYVSNAGADVNGSSFLDAPLKSWLQLINRNVAAVVETSYGFARPMCERGHGGLLLMSSGTALGGQPGAAVYCGTKAFDMNFAEALWAELLPFGVDVLSGVCPVMDTPSLQRLLARHDLKVPGIYDPEQVVATLLATLPYGPIHIFPFGPEADLAAQIEQARRQRVVTMTEASKMIFGEGGNSSKSE